MGIDIRHFEVSKNTDSLPLIRLQNIFLQQGNIIGIKSDDFLKAKLFLYGLLGYCSLFPNLRFKIQVSPSIEKLRTQLFLEFPQTQLSGLRVTVATEVALPAENRCFKDIRTRTLSTLNIFRIQNLSQKSPFSLSTGELQKSILASQFITDPEIWALIYPASGLDFESQNTLFQILNERKKEKIILVYDLPYIVNNFSDFILDINNGELSRNYHKEAQNPKLTTYNSKSFKVYRLTQEENTEDLKPVLQIENLCFSYSSSKKLIEDFSLTIKEGEKVVIVGPNGSGKTTLAKLICGIIKPQKGKIQLYTSPFFVPSNPANFFTFPTIEEELLAVNNSLQEFDIDELLEKISLNQKRKEDPNNLTIEEKKLLSIALASASNSQLIILDEPTAFSSSRCQSLTLEFLKEDFKSRSVILITHDIELLQKLF